MVGRDNRMGRGAVEIMSVNTPNKTPVLRTNFVNKGLLSRQEKTRINRMLTNITGRDGIWVRRRGDKTEIGLRAGTKYQFQVEFASSTTVTVRGGWWTYYSSEVRTQVNLGIDAVSTSLIPDFLDTTDPITVTGIGVIYLELDTDAAAGTPAPTLVAKFAENAAWTALADTAEIYRKLIAFVDYSAGDGIIQLNQDYTGGNILTVSEEIRGTPTLFAAPVLRAYLKSDNSLVAATVAYNSGTMYLHKTWDYTRVMA